MGALQIVQKVEANRSNLNIDSRKRSVIKAVGYKLGSIALLALLAWVFTRDLLQMSLITISYEIIAIAGYYAYERIWERVKWGRRFKVEEAS